MGYVFAFYTRGLTAARFWEVLGISFYFSYDRRENMCIILYYFTDCNSDMINAKWLCIYGIFPQKLYWAGPQPCVLLPAEGATVVHSVINKFLYLQNVCHGVN